ncbi:hypothetical protein [Haloarcula sp. JP-L23]|uniref:hypothetical protein n=1 Tax=Haloarcula sp. JP-L23 TaxID=2716717 RepID=UPI00140F491C|nr:hypothetical protein G9465_03030 [Haloarcula sp. JP-L23]
MPPTGRAFVEDGVDTWTIGVGGVTVDGDGEGVRARLTAGDGTMAVRTSETTVYARAANSVFRTTMLQGNGETYQVLGVGHQGLLDVAHLLPWRAYPE